MVSHNPDTAILTSFSEMSELSVQEASSLIGAAILTSFSEMGASNCFWLLGNLAAILTSFSEIKEGEIGMMTSKNCHTN